MFVRYSHVLSGRTFEGTHPGTHGASVAGTWDSGEAGVIYPAEQLADGRPVWTAETVWSPVCPSCGLGGVVVGLDGVLLETWPAVRRHGC